MTNFVPLLVADRKKVGSAVKLSSSGSSTSSSSSGSNNNNNNNNSNNNSSSSSNKCRDAFDFSEATELEFAVDGDLRPVPLVRNGRLMFRLISMKRAIKSPAAMEALLHWPAHRWRADRTEGLDHLWQESPRRIRRFQLDDSIRLIHLGESYQICGREAGRRRRRRMGGGKGHGRASIRISSAAMTLD